MSGPLSVADVLERAADLIEPEGAWTQDYAARDANGGTAYAWDKRAVCFCVWGAIAKASDVFVSSSEYTRAFAKAAGIGASANLIGAWNDSPRRTQAEVVAKLREAANLARARSAEFGNIGADGVQS